MQHGIIKDDLSNYLNKFNKKYDFSVFLIFVCIITILVKFCLFIYTYIISKRDNNLLVKANSKDHFNDVIMTSCNLISCILAYYDIFLFDGIVSVCISLWILFGGFKIFREAYDVLMDKAIDNVSKEKVYSIIKKHKEIKKIQHFNSNPVGYKYHVSFTIFVDGNLTTFESHDIADRIEKEIMDLDEIYLAVIHVNPIEVKHE